MKGALTDWQLIEQLHAEKLTMCSPARCVALIEHARRVVQAGIVGDFVVCGVWRGGLAVLLASILKGTGRRLFLYDTFAGMVEPGEKDGATAARIYGEMFDPVGRSVWCRAELNEVRANLARHGVPPEMLELVPGDVCRTLRDRAPARVALAYLDTDFYNSTRAELEILYPKLSEGGAMFIDDYGTWPGCRAAVDEFFTDRPETLGGIDAGCRYVVKPCS